MVDNGKYWIGFDLGGTKMLAVLYDADFKKIATKRKKTKGHEGADAGVDRIVKTIEGALEEAGVGKAKLAGIGVGCPGPLDPDKGIVLNTPNLGWVNVPLKEKLERAFECPAVVANDVDVGVFAEYRFGAGKKERCVLGVFPGTGIGGGCVYEGRILRGRNRSALEIGHMQLQPEGPLCGCGQRGCLESLASRLAISAAVAVAAFRGESPYIMENAKTDLADIRSGVLAAAIEKGDKIVKQIVEKAADWIGVAVANCINLLAPEVVVLGGGLVEAMPELFCNAVEKMANKRVMPSFKDTFKVRAAELGDDATVKGAAAWAREVIESESS